VGARGQGGARLTDGARRSEGGGRAPRGLTGTKNGSLWAKSGGGGEHRARERGGGVWDGIGPAEEGEEFSFFFLFSLYFFLNSFSPLYKYSFMFPRCQNEI
jgi:hypothetical protein